MAHDRFALRPKCWHRDVRPEQSLSQLRGGLLLAHRLLDNEPQATELSGSTTASQPQRGAPIGRCLPPDRSRWYTVAAGLRRLERCNVLLHLRHGIKSTSVWLPFAVCGHAILGLCTYGSSDPTFAHKSANKVAHTNLDAGTRLTELTYWSAQL